MREALLALAVILIGASVGLIVALRRLWRGPHRQWAIGPWGPLIVYLLPSVLVALAVGAVVILAPNPVGTFAIFVALGVGVVSVFSAVSEPRWWGPPWYHGARREYHAPDMAEYQGLDCVTPAPGANLSSTELAAEVFGGQMPVERWPGILFHEPNQGLRKFGVRDIRELRGVLEVRVGGLAFVPNAGSQRMMRDGPYVVPIEAGEIQAVWVVLPGFEPDGSGPVGARLTSGFLHRLAVQTERGTFLFGIPLIHERARRIAELIGCRLVA